MAKKKRKPDIWDELGYDKERCPVCKVRKRNGICLNACHLSAESRARMNAILAECAAAPEKKP